MAWNDLGGLFRFSHHGCHREKKTGEKYRFGKWLDSRDDKARAGAHGRHTHPPPARGSAFR